ncbi:MAG: LysM peptidoglycan-binding domain-containing protein [Anaerolineae bacterium]|nr:LysM peptidoglycan-binding domain-containing protein [Anaerolineae bacterium]
MLKKLAFALAVALVAAVPASVALADRTPADCADGQWEVRPNQTLYSIAYTCGVRVSQLVAANGLSNPNLITTGQILVIPVPGGSTTPAPAASAASGQATATPRPASTPAPALASGPNLLVNGGFEEPYYRLSTPEVTAAVANGWSIWFYNDAGAVYDAPEYEIAPRRNDPFRVRSGEAAQMYFRPYVMHLAGVYQTVVVPNNATVQFSVWGHSWSSFCDPPDDQGMRPCNARLSNSPLWQRVGIDPTGGTDAFAPTVIWSSDKLSWDNFSLFAIQAKAQGNRVTVFTYSRTEFPSQVNNAYWDDAALVVAR